MIEARDHIQVVFALKVGIVQAKGEILPSKRHILYTINSTTFVYHKATSAWMASVPLKTTNKHKFIIWYVNWLEIFWYLQLR